MGTEPDQLTKANLLRLVESVSDAYPEVSVRLLRELVEVHEWRVALEILCDNLHEVPGPIRRETLQLVVPLAKAAGLDESYWHSLAELCLHRP